MLSLNPESMDRYIVVLKPIGIFILSWMGLLFIQWCLINLYIAICIDTSLWGIIVNAASMGSPLCHFINTVQYEITKNYIVLCGTGAAVVTTWIMVKLQN